MLLFRVVRRFGRHGTDFVRNSNEGQEHAQLKQIKGGHAFS
jgi:hypothetical protein